MKHKIEQVRVNQSVLFQAREIYQNNAVLLENYIDLLLEWNQKINLVSRNVSRETVREHVVHSLLPLPLNLLAEHKKWIDSGTGGGLPGLPLAICRSDLMWILNDNVRKKIRAVDDIIERAGIKNCKTFAKSISLVNVESDTGIATKHAFKIPDLLRLLGKNKWSTILMWKGAADAEQEIHQCRQNIRCSILEFDFDKDESFYEGKGLVLIKR